MSRLSKAAAEMKEVQKLRPDQIVNNFMGGDSYAVSPLTTLKLVTASSIFGEPSYYRDGSYAGKRVKDGVYKVHALLELYDVFADYNGKTTTEIMESVIDDALDADFTETLNWAVTLRKEYLMRLNPQVIMVRAAMHPKRKEFTDANPGIFNSIQQQVMRRADEPATQLAYYLFKNKGQKNKLPSVLKRSIANKLSSLNLYKIAKYKNHEIGIINAVRLTHANSPVLDELMKTGKLETPEESRTWENLRSEGKTWVEILDTIDIGHMALLRNLRNIFEEIDNREFCVKVLDILKQGVSKGKQFPFRYWSAMKAVKDSDVNHKPLILEALEECIDIAIENMPKLKGKTMCLSDNSGSAWGTMSSEYGSVTIAEIDNLSSVLTAMCSDEGYVGKFGDKLIVHPVHKRNGALSQAEAITQKRDKDVGGSTEGGIWEFFRDAVRKKEHWDNIFIYSDQQAGTGGLYGTDEQGKEYLKDFGAGGRYINVFKLILEYRRKVNPKVNVFSIQTAGYNNVVIPEAAYRTHILSGWTGKEANFAASVIELWDEADMKQ